jgi:hypothetical protein
MSQYQTTPEDAAAEYMAKLAQQPAEPLPPMPDGPSVREARPGEMYGERSMSVDEFGEMLANQETAQRVLGQAFASGLMTEQQAAMMQGLARQAQRGELDRDELKTALDTMNPMAFAAAEAIGQGVGEAASKAAIRGLGRFARSDQGQRFSSGVRTGLERVGDAARRFDDAVYRQLNPDRFTDDGAEILMESTTPRRRMPDGEMEDVTPQYQRRPRREREPERPRPSDGMTAEELEELELEEAEAQARMQAERALGDLPAPTSPRPRRTVDRDMRPRPRQPTPDEPTDMFDEVTQPQRETPDPRTVTPFNFIEDIAESLYTQYREDPTVMEWLSNLTPEQRSEIEGMRDVPLDAERLGAEDVELPESAMDPLRRGDASVDPNVNEIVQAIDDQVARGTDLREAILRAAYEGLIQGAGVPDFSGFRTFVDAVRDALEEADEGRRIVPEIYDHELHAYLRSMYEQPPADTPLTLEDVLRDDYEADEAAEASEDAGTTPRLPAPTDLLNADISLDRVRFEIMDLLKRSMYNFERDQHLIPIVEAVTDSLRWLKENTFAYGGLNERGGHTLPNALEMPEESMDGRAISIPDSFRTVYKAALQHALAKIAPDAYTAIQRQMAKEVTAALSSGFYDGAAFDFQGNVVEGTPRQIAEYLVNQETLDAADAADLTGDDKVTRLATLPTWYSVLHRKQGYVSERTLFTDLWSSLQIGSPSNTDAVEHFYRIVRGGIPADSIGDGVAGNGLESLVPQLVSAAERLASGTNIRPFLQAADSTDMLMRFLGIDNLEHFSRIMRLMRGGEGNATVTLDRMINNARDARRHNLQDARIEAGSIDDIREMLNLPPRLSPEQHLKATEGILKQRESIETPEPESLPSIDLRTSASDTVLQNMARRGTTFVTPEPVPVIGSKGPFLDEQGNPRMRPGGPSAKDQFLSRLGYKVSTKQATKGQVLRLPANAFLKPEDRPPEILQDEMNNRILPALNYLEATQGLDSFTAADVLRAQDVVPMHFPRHRGFGSPSLVNHTFSEDGTNINLVDDRTLQTLQDTSLTLEGYKGTGREMNKPELGGDLIPPLARTGMPFLKMYIRMYNAPANEMMAKMRRAFEPLTLSTDFSTTDTAKLFMAAMRFGRPNPKLPTDEPWRVAKAFEEYIQGDADLGARYDEIKDAIRETDINMAEITGRPPLLSGYKTNLEVHTHMWPRVLYTLLMDPRYAAGQPMVSFDTLANPHFSRYGSYLSKKRIDGEIGELTHMGFAGAYSTMHPDLPGLSYVPFEYQWDPAQTAGSLGDVYNWELYDPPTDLRSYSRPVFNPTPITTIRQRYKLMARDQLQQAYTSKHDYFLIPTAEFVNFADDIAFMNNANLVKQYDEIAPEAYADVLNMDVDDFPIVISPIGDQRLYVIPLHEEAANRLAKSLQVSDDADPRVASALKKLGPLYALPLAAMPFEAARRAMSKEKEPPQEN